jgi:hypothetical protein
MTAPMQARTTALPQTAPATYPAAEPTVVQQVASTPATSASAHSVWAPHGPTTSTPIEAEPSVLPASMPWAVPATGPRTSASSAAGALPVTGVPAHAFPPASPAQEELFSSRRNQQSSSTLMNRLRTPMAALVASGAVMFAVGFGSGFVVGKDRAGSVAVTDQPGGAAIPGAVPGGGTGTGTGQGRRGFGGPMGQQGTDQGTGQGPNQGTDQGTGVTGQTTDSTGLADSQ